MYVNGTLIGSKTSRSTRSSYVWAFWCNEEGTIDIECTDLTHHPGQIVKIYMHSIVVNGCAHPYYLAKVNWFQQLPDSLRHYYGKPRGMVIRYICTGWTCYVHSYPED
jgi:hypothetical protein